MVLLSGLEAPTEFWSSLFNLLLLPRSQGCNDNEGLNHSQSKKKNKKKQNKNKQTNKKNPKPTPLTREVQEKIVGDASKASSPNE